MAESLSISQLFELYRSDYIVMKNQSPKTEESYLCAKNLLIKKFGDIDFCSLTFEDIRDWRNWLLTWQKPDTARNNIICIRMVLKFALKRGYKVLNYDEIPVANREKRTITFLNEKELWEFIDEAGRKVRGYSEENRLRNVAIITLLAATGLRNGELCSLDRKSIKERTFTVVGKSRDPRIGFVTRRAQEAIDAYLAIRTDNNMALFISPQTGSRIRPDTIRKIFKNICERSDFEEIHPHTIRHSFATLLIEHKVDLIYVNRLLGHVSMDTTKMYIHYADPALKGVYDGALV